MSGQPEVQETICQSEGLRALSEPTVWTIYVCEACGGATGRHKDCGDAKRLAMQVVRPEALVEQVRTALGVRAEILAVPGMGERRLVADRNRISRPPSQDAVLLDDVWQVLDDVAAQLR